MGCYGNQKGNMNTIDRTEILNSKSIEQVLAAKGHMPVIRKADSLEYLCPIHNEKTPSFKVTISKKLFHCFGCGFAGSVIDLVSKLDSISAGEAMKKLSNQEVKSSEKLKMVCKYEYTDETKKPIYEVVRCEPKTFRQRHKVGENWVWNMEGVRRVLYNLPKVLKATRVWIVEGEKDADNLNKLGFIATCNVGGAGKWSDAYSDCLKGKEVVLCGDNDIPGQKHIDQILNSLAGKAKSVRKIQIASEYKDVSDFISGYKDQTGAANDLARMADEAVSLKNQIDLPIYSTEEMEEQYIEYIKTIEGRCLDFTPWLPMLGHNVRPLVPGEMMTVIADTGVGKTAVLQNIAHCIKLPTLFFEMELPESLMFERFLSMESKMNGKSIEKTYKQGGRLNHRNLSHIHVCPLSKLDPEKIEELIVKSELKIGVKPAIVMLDYIGLISDKGNSRYERLSAIAEKIKIIAKSTKTIIIIASQIHRQEGEITLHSAKDSGSIENSSGLVLAASRDANDKEKMFLKILKNTKGTSGLSIPCWFYGETLQIRESARI